MMICSYPRNAGVSDSIPIDVRMVAIRTQKEEVTHASDPRVASSHRFASMGRALNRGAAHQNGALRCWVFEANGHCIDEEGWFTFPRPNPEDMFIGLGGGVGKARFLPLCRVETGAKDSVHLTLPSQTSRYRLIRR